MPVGAYCHESTFEVLRVTTIAIICPVTNVPTEVRVAGNDIVHEAQCPACGEKHYWLARYSDSQASEDEALPPMPLPTAERLNR